MKASTGVLVLMPNTLDFGAPHPVELTAVLPMAVIQRAAGLTHWVGENAKTTRAFLNRVAQVTPLSSPVQAVEIVELPKLRKGVTPTTAPDMTPLLAPLKAGHDLGLISEAGLPAVADPGALLVQAAHTQGFQVDVLPGASALLLALAASGMNGQSFAFVGYLPVPAAERAARIKALEAHSRKAAQTQILIETPYRNEVMLAALVATLAPTTRLSVSCGLTLAGGFTWSDTVAAWHRRSLALPDRLPAVFCLLA